MTQVEYDREGCWMLVSGHAGQNLQGQDIVCAGVSAVMMTLLAWTELETGARAETGHAEAEILIRCRPDKKNRRACRLAMDAAFAALRKIEREWPEHVRTQER